MVSWCIPTCLVAIIFFWNITADGTDNWSVIEDDSDYLPASSILEDWSDLIITAELKERDSGKVMKKPTNADRIVNKKPNKTQDITETDLFLLGAIEKLAYRVDHLEQRVQRTEELIYQLYTGNKVEDLEPCPDGFQRQQGICYHFSTKQMNWKSSSSMCRSMGGVLLEFNNEVERVRLISSLIESSVKENFWTGGLNPGLLWLWGNSAKPVETSNSTDNTVYGSGRCLLLGFQSPKSYRYLGTDCAERHRYICQIEDNTVRNKLLRFLKEN